MKVTIYTDAAFCPVRRLGAWAAWCRSDGGRIQKSALCPPSVANSFHAELCAGLEGIKAAKAAWPDMTFAWVVSDCEGIRPHMEGRPTKSADPVVAAFRREIAATGIEVEARWVKGHQSPRAGTQAWLNNAVDGAAGKVLRAHKESMTPACPPELAAIRERLRGELGRRYGTHLEGLREGRAVAASMLGVRRVKVGRLSAEQCARVLAALGNNVPGSTR